MQPLEEETGREGDEDRGQNLPGWPSPTDRKKEKRKTGRSEGNKERQVPLQIKVLVITVSLSETRPLKKKPIEHLYVRQTCEHLCYVTHSVIQAPRSKMFPRNSFVVASVLFLPDQRSAWACRSASTTSTAPPRPKHTLTTLEVKGEIQTMGQGQTVR